MAKLLNLSIDVTKLDKKRFFVGKKGTYAKLTVSVNDELDAYGQDVGCWIEQSQEERAAGEKKQYLGNGKVFWSNDHEQRPVDSGGYQSGGFQPEPTGTPDDIPF